MKKDHNKVWRTWRKNEVTTVAICRKCHFKMVSMDIGYVVTYNLAMQEIRSILERAKKGEL